MLVDVAVAHAGAEVSRKAGSEEGLTKRTRVAPDTSTASFTASRCRETGTRIADESEEEAGDESLSEEDLDSCAPTRSSSAGQAELESLREKPLAIRRTITARSDLGAVGHRAAAKTRGRGGGGGGGAGEEGQVPELERGTAAPSGLPTHFSPYFIERADESVVDVKDVVWKTMMPFAIIPEELGVDSREFVGYNPQVSLFVTITVPVGFPGAHAFFGRDASAIHPNMWRKLFNQCRLHPGLVANKLMLSDIDTTGLPDVVPSLDGTDRAQWNTRDMKHSMCPICRVNPAAIAVHVDDAFPCVRCQCSCLFRLVAETPSGKKNVEAFVFCHTCGVPRREISSGEELSTKQIVKNQDPTTTMWWAFNDRRRDWKLKRDADRDLGDIAPPNPGLCGFHSPFLTDRFD